MKRNHRVGLARKYYVFLVNLKMEIEKNPYLSINLMLRNHHIDLRLNGALYDLNIVKRGRKKQWLGYNPDLEMANKCIKQIYEKRKVQKIAHSEKYFNTTHEEFQKENPKAVRVGNGYFHPNKEKKFWSEILSFKIFGIKCKFFKLK
tara:strand:+ start:3870 stop:4310 length:441 start_codon:yes stop_codon:yes gene_type:complete